MAPQGPIVLEVITQGQRPVLDNLVQLYAHDFSEYAPLELGHDGRFDVSLGDAWWSSADHFPYFIRFEGALVGFALLCRGSRISQAKDVMDVAEFFVVRGARGKGIGLAVAHELFRRFPGTWEIRVREANKGARAFWASVVERWIGQTPATESFTAKEVGWALFRFEADR
jgi:predicted acetyltransferase